MENGRSIEQSQHGARSLTRREFVRGSLSVVLAGSAGLISSCTAETQGPGIQIAHPSNLSEDEAIKKMRADFAHVNPDILAAHREPALLQWDRPIWRPKTARVSEYWLTQRYATLAIMTPESEAPILGGHKPRIFVTTMDNRLVRAESLDVQAAANVFSQGELTEDVKNKRTVVIGLDSGTIRRSAAAIALSGMEIYFEIDKPNSVTPSEDSKRRYSIHPMVK